MTAARIVSRWSALVLSVACAPAVGPGEGRSDAAPERPEPAVARDPAPSPEPSPAPGSSMNSESEGPFEVIVDGRGPSAPEQVLVSPAGPAHAEHVGWSVSGDRFIHCRALIADCYECRLVARDGAVQSFESGRGCPAGIPRERLDARLAAAAPRSGAPRWRFGAEVVVVVETREAEQTNAGEPRPMLKLGARRREGGPVTWLLHVDPCEGCGVDQICAGQAHLDALTLSPDGHEVVALVHARGNDGSAQMRIERLSSTRLVEAARAPATRANP